MCSLQSLGTDYCLRHYLCRCQSVLRFALCRLHSFSEGAVPNLHSLLFLLDTLLRNYWSSPLVGRGKSSLDGDYH